MCLFSPPKPPALPKAEASDSAIEDTADKVVIGDDRTTTKSKLKTKPKTKPKRLGTSSLQIPLNPGVQSGNLNYPV
tara:strand:- start:148 stop:375 length:228 start_codon:yes stop_codon:yes gene_type:complete